MASGSDDGGTGRGFGGYVRAVGLAVHSLLYPHVPGVVGSMI